MGLELCCDAYQRLGRYDLLLVDAIALLDAPGLTPRPSGLMGLDARARAGHDLAGAG